MTRLPCSFSWLVVAALGAACGGASSFDGEAAPAAGRAGDAGERGGASGSHVGGGSGSDGGTLSGGTGGTGTGGDATGGTGSGGKATGGAGTGGVATGGTGSGGKATGGAGTGGSLATGGAGGVGGTSSCPMAAPQEAKSCSPAMTCFYSLNTGCLCSDSTCTIVTECLPRPKRQGPAERVAPIAGAPGVAGSSGITAPIPPLTANTCVCDGTSWSCSNPAI